MYVHIVLVLDTIVSITITYVEFAAFVVVGILGQILVENILDWVVDMMTQFGADMVDLEEDSFGSADTQDFEDIQDLEGTLVLAVDKNIHWRVDNLAEIEEDSLELQLVGNLVDWDNLLH